MRRIPPPARRTPRYALPLTATAFLLTSCAWGTAETPGTQPPPPPLGVTAQAGSATTVHVMWSSPGDSGTAIDGYEVYRGGKKVKEVPGAEYMVDITGLKPSSTYTFTVRARDAKGVLGEPSKGVSATTPKAVAADDRAPTRPAKLTGKPAGSRAASLTWGASKDNSEVVSYDIYQGETKIHSVGGDVTRTTVTGLRPGTAYVFTVKARDAADNSSPASGAVRLTTAGAADDGRATAPRDFRASTHRADGGYFLDLTWDPPETDGTVMRYQIQLDREQVTTLVWGTAPRKGRAEHSFYVDREAGVTHRVRIRAMLPDGTWGGYSAERTVVTGQPESPAP
ncbi:fibronectin type III domain-containing protein [Streptomyces sp. NPDC058001]|uniref:fibronectin type III domain-containing protein n=1 Tax=Streptomyces sp. NPDC058001 TaxID=3346300 RepID=UPI0036E4F7C3